MFLAVPNLFGIALNLDAVPIRPLDAEDRSFEPPPSPPRRDIGLLDGGRDSSIAKQETLKCRRNEMKFVQQNSLELFVLLEPLTWQHRFCFSSLESVMVAKQLVPKRRMRVPNSPCASERDVNESRLVILINLQLRFSTRSIYHTL